ncbi:MAG: EAL domain-containing protein [Pirellulales bacterium]|nr:EAL domain-containing protein [Pirellulales bacterium]
MRTQVMHERAPGIPWLEHYPTDGGQPQQTILDDFPFVIGRSEDSDLTIESNRVSRRHVEILHDDDGYRIRDLGSTNGTILNGQRIEEARLSDGDLFVVADLELTFFAGRAAAPSDMVTQAIDFLASHDTDSRAVRELVREVRRLDEVLAHRAISVCYQPIVELATKEVFAHILCESEYTRDNGTCGTGQSMLETDCRLSARYRRLKRMLAVEQAVQLPNHTFVFLKLDEVEIGDKTLGKSLEKLSQTLPDTMSLVAVIPQRSVSDATYFRRLFARLRAAGIQLAYDGVAGEPPTVINQLQMRPDYLIMAKSLAQDIQQSSRRQRQLEIILQSSDDCGCEVIATALKRQEDAEFCCRAGCRYGQGQIFTRTQTTPAADACLTH